MKPVLAPDARATEHILHRQGIGKFKHNDVADLWMQDEIRSKRLRVRRVKSEEHVADLGTNQPLSKAVIAKHCLMLGNVNTWLKKMSGVSVKSWRCSGTSVQQSAGDHVQTAASSNRSNRLQQKQRQQAGQETNEVFAGDLEKFSGDRSGCQREDFCITLDYDMELKSTSETLDRENTYKLSDGNIITAGAECFRCGEMLLQPGFIGKEASGIHNASSQSMLKCDADTCNDLQARVVLYDAVAIFQGIGEHTAKECNVRWDRICVSVKVNIVVCLGTKLNPS